MQLQGRAIDCGLHRQRRSPLGAVLGLHHLFHFPTRGPGDGGEAFLCLTSSFSRCDFHVPVVPLQVECRFISVTMENDLEQRVSRLASCMREGVSVQPTRAERGESDAWARIRTWEPLREGILSPSPLTGLGYPRAAAQRPRSVKPFPSRLNRRRQPRLFRVRLLRGRKGASMVRYFTKAFFDELAGRLNADPEWGKKAAAIAAKIVLTCTDRNASFLLDIQGGRVAVHDVAPEVPADFKFEGTYEAWTQLGKGEKDFQGLVLGGKIRFRGSMPKVMALMGPLSRITQLAQQVPKEF